GARRRRLFGKVEPQARRFGVGHEQRFRGTHTAMRAHRILGRSGGGSRRPGTKSLWLLPSGPDQVGDSAVRRLPFAHMGKGRLPRKFMSTGADSSSVVHAGETRSAGPQLRNADAPPRADAPTYGPRPS